MENDWVVGAVVFELKPMIYMEVDKGKNCYGQVDGGKGKV